MLQQDQPDDYVIATGVSHSVRELVEMAFAHVGLDWQQVRDARSGVDSPGRSRTPDRRQHAKRARELGWTPTVDFTTLVKMMVDADLAASRRRRPVR